MTRPASVDERFQVGLVSPLPPQVGGVARVAEWLLSNEDEIGCTYVPFDLERPSSAEIGGRLRLRSVPHQLRLLVRFLAWLPRSPRVLHVAISDSVTGLTRDLVFVAAARAFRRRVVAHVHSLHYGAARGAHVFHVPVLRAIARLSSRCVALGPTAASELERLGVTCSWIFNPVTLGEPSASPPRASDQPLRLLYVGAYGTKKGTADLVEALSRARAAGVDATLCVVGSAMYRGEQEQVAEHVASERLADVVTFAGETDPAGVAAFHAEADVICLPSRQEGLPLALLEGMAAGLPALATAVGCIPDVVEPGSGILVRRGAVAEMAAAIAFFAADPARRRTMGTAARRRVLSVASPARIAAQWRTLYASLA